MDALFETLLLNFAKKHWKKHYSYEIYWPPTGVLTQRRTLEGWEAVFACEDEDGNSRETDLISIKLEDLLVYAWKDFLE